MDIKKQNFIMNLNSITTKTSKGFTLIELLVVIAIIGLLASVVLVALNGARQKSRDATRLADMNQMAKAMELFYNDASAYPTGVGTQGTGANYVCAVGAAGCGGQYLGRYQLSAVNLKTGSGSLFMTPTFLTALPDWPLPPDGSCSTNQSRFMYESNMAGNTYTLTFCLGDPTGGLSCPTSGACVHFMTPGGFR